MGQQEGRPYRHMWRLPLNDEDDIVVCMTDGGAVDIARYGRAEPGQAVSMTSIALDTPGELAAAHRLLDVALWHVDPAGLWRRGGGL